MRALQRDWERPQLVTRVTTTFNGSTIRDYQYAYDILGRITNRVDNGMQMNAFTYNPRSEVLYSLFGTNENTYAYDDIGNHDLHPANKLNQYATPSIAYDADGNMIQHGDISFTWDAENRLVSAGSVTNSYDYKHRRVRKNSTAYLYDGWNLLRKTTGEDVRHYFWGLDLSDSLQVAGGVGGLLAVSQGVDMYYPVYDNNGNITAYLDGSGNIVAAYDYNAFGETLSQSGSKANDFAFRFSTKYHDTETGLYYYGYRFYSPELHTWLNRDPIGEDGGLNLYGFCRNNGVIYTDKLGLQIRLSTSFHLNESYLSNGERGMVSLNRTEPIKISCRGKWGISISGAVDLRLYLLMSTSERWSERFDRYNEKWGTPRANAHERAAVYAHEMDHYKTFTHFVSFIRTLNSSEGSVRCCSAKSLDGLESDMRKMWEKVEAHSKLFDTKRYNYGGAYDENPFK